MTGIWCFRLDLGVTDQFWRQNFGAFTEKASTRGSKSLEFGFKGVGTWILETMAKQPTRR